MRLWFAILSLAFLTAASAPKYKGLWLFDPVVDSSSTIFEKGKYQKIGRVVPARLFQLSGDSAVSAGLIGYLGRGTLMVPVDDSMRKFCRLERHLGSAFGCLLDSDGDGQLETFFGTQVFKEFFTGSVGDDGGHEPLTQPISFVEVDTLSESPEIDIELVYLGKSKKNQAIYQFCFSKKIADNKKFYQSPLRKGFSVICSEKFRTAIGPITKIEGFGVEITLASADNKTMLVESIRSTGKAFETSSGFR